MFHIAQAGQKKGTQNWSFIVHSLLGELAIKAHCRNVADMTVCMKAYYNFNQ